MVSEEVRKSKQKFEGINYHLAAIYLASTMTPEMQIKDGIRQLIPHRKVKTNKGRRSMIHSRELGGSKWWNIIGELNDEGEEVQSDKNLMKS